MRQMLIVGGVGLLSMAAATGIADDDSPSYRKTHVRGEIRIDSHMRPGGGHIAVIGPLGIYLATPVTLYGWEAEPGPVPIIPAGGLVAGRPEHMMAGHLAGPASHLPGQILAHVGAGEALIPQATGSDGAGSAPSNAAVARANPTASPATPLPPGASGPGRRQSGWSGPGRSGPGRPAGSRW
ncbi:MAG: hypothetical protein ACP5XB_09100 [Isosphaeraceae bacterium]